MVRNPTGVSGSRIKKTIPQGAQCCSHNAEGQIRNCGKTNYTPNKLDFLLCLEHKLSTTQ